MASQNTSLSLSLNQKLKLLCCCNEQVNDEQDYDEEINNIQKVLEHSGRINSKSINTFIAWLKSEFPEIKSIFVKKQQNHKRNRRVNSSEFKYDPLSYALNFEDDDSRLDEFPLRNFSSRLPASPVKETQNGVVSSWS